MTALTAGLRRYTANSTGLYLTRIFLALAGAAAFPGGSSKLSGHCR